MDMKGQIQGRSLLPASNVKVDLVSDTLNRHERIHTGKKPNACSKCKIFDGNGSSKKHEAFKTSGEMKIHERIHTGKKPFVWFKCENTFSQ